jgi:acyl carrier protein
VFDHDGIDRWPIQRLLEPHQRVIVGDQIEIIIRPRCTAAPGGGAFVSTDHTLPLENCGRALAPSEWRKCMENKMTEASKIIQEIKHILVKDMQLNVIPEEIPDNYSLLESGLALDSILIAELITRIEDRFGLRFDDNVLNAELFNNLSLLAGFVAQRQPTVQFNVTDSQSEEAIC